MSFSACAASAATTPGGLWPTASIPIPPAKSMNVLPSTSWTSAPSARSATTSVALPRPPATAEARRARISRLFGPGISVWIRIAPMSPPRLSPCSSLAGHVARGVEDDEDGVIVAHRVVQVVREQPAQLEPDLQLRRERRVVDRAVLEPPVILLGRHPILHRAVSAHHPGRDLALQAEAAHGV